MESEAKSDSIPGGSTEFAAYLEDRLEKDVIQEVQKDETTLDMRESALLMEKKLVLLINMDTVLLDMDNTEDLTMEELLKCPVIPDLYKRDEHESVFNLRPFARKFLEEARKLFDIWIFTALDIFEGIRKQLDPQDVYFPSRLITSEPEPNVDIGHVNRMIILDNTEEGWEYKNNLITVKGCHFFAHTAHKYDPASKSVIQLGIDETESEGILSRMLITLRTIHKRFFDPESNIELGMRDVRQILSALRKEILWGCRILFCQTQLDLKKFQTMAEAMGAVLCSESDESVTHVVATVSNTNNVIRADRFFVNPCWIEAAFYHWRRPNEGDFAVP